MVCQGHYAAHYAAQNHILARNNKQEKNNVDSFTKAKLKRK